jgi:hypothetical protein
VHNREHWLSEAVLDLTPMLKRHRLDVPPDIRVSCGFPSKGGASMGRPPITGETWPSTATFDGSVQVFISPLEDEPTGVLGILIRELIHASLPDDAAFGPVFKQACKDVGLEGRAKNMAPGLILHKQLDEVAEKLGDYPNKHIILSEKEKLDKPKKKSTFKLFCASKRECGKPCHLLDKAVGEDYIVSMTTKKLTLGFPICPCGQEMVMEETDFLLYQGGTSGAATELREVNDVGDVEQFSVHESED